jgi:hypothetical protein
VPDPEFLSYRPKWADLYEPDDPGAAEAPFAGVPAVVRPQLVTRILPKEGRETLSALSLTEIISTTQRGIQFAGYDEVWGLNPNFSDLRKIGPEVTKLTRLDYGPESFREGSFVIEAELPDEEVTVRADQEERRVTSWQVLRRFGTILSAISNPQEQAKVSIGAIQAVEDLGKTLRREAERIEFRTILSADDVYHARAVAVDSAFIGHAAKLLTTRQTGRASLQSLEGTLTAIDIRKLSLKLTLPDARTTVQGSFSELIQYPLARAVGLRVRLTGDVEYRGRRPRFIQAQHFELLDEPV